VSENELNEGEIKKPESWLEKDEIDSCPEEVYDLWHNSKDFRELVDRYHNRFPGNYWLVLTVYDKEKARDEAEKIRNTIRNKTVIEIGAGTGLLAMEMAKHAKEVYAFEIDPAWSWIFVKKYMYDKPSNLNFIFGDAKNFKFLRPDVVVVYACQALDYFLEIAREFNPEIIILNGRNLINQELK